MIKFLALIVILTGITAVTAASVQMKPQMRRIWLCLIVLLSLKFPIMTLDFHMGERHNVRGWEFCWSDPIALGLIIGQLLRGSIPTAWMSIMTLIWAFHFGVLIVSSFTGVDLEFSLFYVFRQLRGFLIYLAVLFCLQDDSDFRALLMSLGMACLINEYVVLKQKYIEGRFQCPGVFDHQNAMSMYMGLIGPVLVATLLLRPVSNSMLFILVISLGANMHAVLSALSRAGMAVWAAMSVGAAASSLSNGINKHKMAIVAGAGACGILVVLAMLPTLLARFGDSSANKASHRTREVMNDAAELMYKDRFLLGWGPNNFAYAVNREPYSDLIDISILEKGHKVDPDYKRGIVESHYYQMKAETGFLGYYSFLAAMAWTLIMGFVKQFSNGHLLYRALAIGITFGLIGNYAQSRIEHTLVNYTNLYLWMTYCAILSRLPWRSVRVIENEENTPAKGEQKHTFAAPTSVSNQQSEPSNLPPVPVQGTPAQNNPPPAKGKPRFWT